jgi:hypothetical protein
VLFRLSSYGGGLTGILCGGPAGPSQPVVWNSVNVFSSTSAGIQVVNQWYEGFHWRGGLIDPVMSNGQATGIYCGGESTIENIDTADGPWLYVIESNGGPQTYNNIEFPPISDVYYHIGSGAPSIVIMNPAMSEANAPTTKLSILHFQPQNLVCLKTLGCTFGYQLTPFTVPSRWQAVIGTGNVIKFPSTGQAVIGTGNVIKFPSTGQAVIGIGNAIENSVASPIADTDYRANTDFRLVVSGGIGVKISILDDYGNIIQSGLTDFSGLIKAGEHINFGPFTSTPTVGVYQC